MARYLIGQVRRVGQVGRREVLLDKADEADGSDGAKSYWTARCLDREVVPSSDGWGRVEKIGYIYPPGACGMDHRMVVGDHFAKVFVDIYYE